MAKNNNSLASYIAGLALLIEAIKLGNSKKIFTWAKGWKTPIYNDNRLHLGYTENYQAIAGGLCARVIDNGKEVDGVVGTTSAGIPWGALLAERLNKPFFMVSEGKIYICKNLFARADKTLEEKILAADIIATDCPTGMPYGMILADRYKKGFIFVRKDPKSHGLKNQIEGPYQPGQKVLYLATSDLAIQHCELLFNQGLIVENYILDSFELQEFNVTGLKLVIVEDLISTGGSYIEEVSVCRKAGAIVEDVYCIFNYEFPIAKKNADGANVIVHNLFTYDQLLEKALEKNYIPEENLVVLKEWRLDPEAWSDKYGGTNFKQAA